MPNDIGLWQLLIVNTPTGVALIVVVAMFLRSNAAHAERSAVRAAQGAADCHAVQKVANEAMLKNGEAVARLADATAANTQQLTQLTIMIAQCVRNSSTPTLPPEPDVTD